METALRILRWPLVRLLLATILLVGAGFVGSAVILLVEGLAFGPEVVQIMEEGDMSLLGIAVAAPLYGYLAVLSLGVLLLLGLVIERRSLREIGLCPRALVPHLAAGFAMGACLIIAVMVALVALRAYRITGVPLLESPARTVGGVAALAVIMAFVAIFEEVVFRGILLRLLEEAFGWVVALAGSSLVFGLVHAMNPNATTASLLLIAAEAGILLGLVYMATRQLWVAIGLHWAWNLMLSGLFGANVSGLTTPSILRSEPSGPHWLSGGAFGPEESLVTLAFSGLLSVAAFAVVARRGWLYHPGWMRRIAGLAPRPLPWLRQVPSEVSGAPVSPPEIGASDA